MADNLKEKAYRFIKNQIVACDYEPGAFLNEAMLMEEVGVSRTPIREALNKLEQENLVRIVPKKGVMVSELSIKEISDIYQVREILEPQIIRLWGPDIPVEELRRCRENFAAYTHQLTLDERNRLDDTLHRLITGTCQNHFMNRMLEHLYLQNQRIRVVAGQLEERMEQNLYEHLSIADHLLAGEYEEAAAELWDHLENAKKAAFESLIRGGTRGSHR